MSLHLEVNPDLMSAGPSQELPQSVILVVEDDEESPFIRTGECRICQEEDSLHNLESPCACSGSLKYAHRKCVQHWCNEKGDTNCEICHEPYQPDYIAPPRSSLGETSIDIGELWQISGDVNDPRLLTITEAERQMLETDYDAYNAANTSGTAFYRSAALALMAFLLLRHALSIADDGDGDEDASRFFSVFWFRIFRFLLPCYIMLWAISILQRLRQRQEEAALAAARFTIVVQSAQRRGLIVAAAASGSSSNVASLTNTSHGFD